jgi:hypothetical protein
MRNSHLSKRQKAKPMSTAITIRMPLGSKRLADNDQWKNRFEIRSATSTRIYIVAQNKQSGKFGCSCPGYLSNRKCKHLLEGCNLTTSQIHGRDQFEEKKRAHIGD